MQTRIRQAYNVAFLFPLVAIAALLTAGCAINPLKTAETPAQKAYAIESAYNVLLEDGLDIAKNASTSQSVRAAIQNASAIATPVIDSLSDALVAYEVERAKVDAGQSTVEKLQVIADNLTSWISRAQSALLQLRAAF